MGWQFFTAPRRAVFQNCCRLVIEGSQAAGRRMGE
jgi:hypothetical protein